MAEYLNIYENELGDKVFRYEFPSIISLVNYIKQTPVNKKSFPKCWSMDPGNDFYGESLEESLEKVILGYNAEYEQYGLYLKDNNINFKELQIFNRARNVRSYVGTHVDVNAYIHGDPKCMISTSRYNEKKIVNVYFQISYCSSVSQKAVLHRGLIAAEVIKTLEKLGYTINLNAFVLDCEKIPSNDNKREIFLVKINIKNLDEPFNASKCVGPFIRVEFQRRILFRLLEVSPVSPEWGINYGFSLKTDDIRKFFNLSEKDILFPPPSELGIEGKNLRKDFQSALDGLSLQEENIKKELKL